MATSTPNRWMATSTRPNPTHSHDRMSMICMSHASFDHSMPTAKSAEAHAEPSKAGKATPPFSKAHKSENSVKKTYHHRMDDGSLSMITHAHGKAHKDHHGSTGGTTTGSEEEGTMMETHGGVTNGDNGGDTTTETPASTTTDATTGAGMKSSHRRSRRCSSTAKRPLENTAGCRTWMRWTCAMLATAPSRVC